MLKKIGGGFTVIEVMMGIGLFAVVAPSIILAIVSINGVNDRAADLTYANIIAERKIESIRSAGYNSLNPGTVDFVSELPPSLRAPRSASYTVTLPVTGVKEVAIQITYTDQTGLRELRYSSLISELGVAQ
jgi:type II secretory pathway pseudopilin PulG